MSRKRGTVDASLRDFSRSLPMALMRTREAVMEQFRPLLRDHGLTEQQWRVLRALSGVKKVSASELAEITCISMPSLSRILGHLEETGLIVRRARPKDRRSMFVSLGAKGRTLIKKVGVQSEWRYVEISKCFGSDRLAILYELLEELETSLKPGSPVGEPSGAQRPDNIALPPKKMRELGYAAVDMLVDHFQTVSEKRVIDDYEWKPANSILTRPFSESGKDPHEVMKLAMDEIFNHSMQMNHPRYFAYVPGSGNFIGALAEQLISGFNPNCVTNQGNLGPITVERNTVSWLCQQFGLPDGASGLFTSGGSSANLIALTAARHMKLNDEIENAVAYCTTETHRCIGRALRILGFKDEQLRMLEPDEDLRMVPDRLIAAIQQDRAAGKTPFCVAVSAGTTSSGAVDPLDDMSSICRTESLWLHVDAAFGGGTILTKRGQNRMKGIDKADTIAVDPHKWFFQPYECGCVLSRDPAWLYETFRDVAVYERDTDAGGANMNYRDMGVQRSRNFKAFKLWMSLQVFGVEAFRRAVDHGLDLAEKAEQILRSRPHWEIVTPATLGIVTFQYRLPDLAEDEIENMNEAMTTELCRTGYAYMSTTLLYGRRVQRLCLNRHDAIEEDLLETISRLESIAKNLRLAR